MISALAPDRPDQAFNIAALPGCTDRGGRTPIPIARTRALKTPTNVRSLSRMRYFSTVPGKRLGDLPRKPLGCRFRVTAVDSSRSSWLATKCVELFEGDRRDHKQINRCNPLGVIAKERIPGLRWPIPPGHHVDRNRRLGDIKAQSEQLAMDTWGAPHSGFSKLILGIEGRAPPCRSAVGPQGAGLHRQ